MMNNMLVYICYGGISTLSRMLIRDLLMDLLRYFFCFPCDDLHWRFTLLFHSAIFTLSPEEGICVLWLTLMSSCDSSHSPCYYLALTMSSLPPTQATYSNRVMELKMLPADQIQRLDHGQRAHKDPLDQTNNILAVGPPLQILQLNKCWMSLSRKANRHQLSIKVK